MARHTGPVYRDMSDSRFSHLCVNCPFREQTRQRAWGLVHVAVGCRYCGKCLLVRRTTDPCHVLNFELIYIAINLASGGARMFNTLELTSVARTQKVGRFNCSRPHTYRLLQCLYTTWRGRLCESYSSQWGAHHSISDMTIPVNEWRS